LLGAQRGGDRARPEAPLPRGGVEHAPSADHLLRPRALPGASPRLRALPGLLVGGVPPPRRSRGRPPPGAGPARGARSRPAGAALAAGLIASDDEGGLLDRLLDQVVRDDGGLEVRDRDLALAPVELVDHPPPAVVVGPPGRLEALPEIRPAAEPALAVVE